MAIQTIKRLVVLAALALLLVACGSGENTTGTSSGSSTSQDTAAEPTAVPTTEPVTTPADEATPAPTTEPTAGTAVATSLAPPSAEAGSTLVAVNAAQWSSNVSIQVTDTSFIYSSNGYPSHELPDQFLVPADGNMPPFSDDDIDADFNIVDTSELIVESPLSEEITLTPVYAETTTDTTLGTIGVTISGVPIFNDYEDFGREFVALDDNLSLNGVYFIDACNGHPLASGLSYHYHGVPYCITDAVDVAGQHSTVIGFLLDGFPLYGSSDAGGVVITGASLDECSGHFGPTPEFPDGIYHYHLTEDMAPYSIDCFHGEIDYSTGGPGGGAGGGPGGGGEGGPPEGAPPEGGPPAGDGERPEGAPPEGEAPPEGAPPEGAPPEGEALPEGAPPEGGEGGPPPGDAAEGTGPEEASGPGGGAPGGGPGGGQGPDFAAAAAALGVTEDALRNAIGGPPPDFEAAAAVLGISAADIQAALDAAS